MTTSAASAQYKPGGTGKGRLEEVNIRAAAASVMVRPMETFGHKINISNTSDDPIKFRFVLQPNPYFRQVSSQEGSYFLNSGDSVSIGFKLLNVNARVNGVYTVFFEMINEYDTLDRKLVEFNVEVYDGIDRQFIIQTLQDNILIRSNIREFEIPVLFRNLLPEAKEVVFEMQNPQNNPIQLNRLFTGRIQLPSRDTVINVRFTVNDRIQELWQFNRSITVYVKNPQGDMIGMFSATPRWLFNKGSLFNPEFMTQPANTLQAEYNYSFFGNNSYSHDLRLTKSLRSDANGLGFNLFYQHFGPQNFRNMTGSYLTYRSNTFTGTVGSITDNHELTLFGRGVKAQQYFDEDKLSQLEVWAVDQEANILRPFDAASGAKTISARFSSKDAEDSRSIAFSSNYFIRPESNSKGHLHFANYAIKFSKTETLTATVGGSMEKFNHPSGDTTLAGYLVKAEYSKFTEKWKYMAGITRGSRDYSGLLQGGTLVNALVGYNLNRQSSITYQFIKNTTDRPGYTPQAIVGRFFNDYNSHEINFTRLYKRFELNIKPYFLRQSQLFTFASNPARPPVGSALRLKTALSGNISKLAYSLEADAGQFSVKNPVTPFSTITTFQLGASVSAYHITVAGFMQNGPYFITELNNLKDPTAEFYTQSLTVSYGNRFFKRLDWQMSGTVINNANFSGAFTSIVQELHYDAGRGLQFNAFFNYYKFSSIPANYQARAGVIKTFNWDNSEKAKVKVTLQLFEDLNSNGVKDAGEKWAPETMVRFDDLILVTDQNGSVQITNVSKEIHKISIIYGSSRQQNFMDRAISVDRNAKILVGVPPQFKINGVVKAPVKKYDETVPEMEGVKVLFIDRNGKEFTTFTGKEGNFSFQLPAGTYKAFLPELKSKNRQSKDLIVVVDPQTGYAGMVEFQWVDEGRQVQIKKL